VRSVNRRHRNVSQDAERSVTVPIFNTTFNLPDQLPNRCSPEGKEAFFAFFEPLLFLFRRSFSVDLRRRG